MIIKSLKLPLAFGALALGAAACGGGGGTSAVPVSPATANPAAPSSVKTASVAFTIVWPQSPTASSSSRTRNYIGKSTASVTISINSGTAVSVNNPNLAAGASGTTATSLVQVPAPVGADTFAVNDYDAANGGGNLLAGNSIGFTVIAGVLNNVGLTLNGNLGKVACAPVAPFVTGTSPTFTQVGPTGQIQLLPEDLDGNVIIAPGVVPTVSLSGPAAMATITKTSTANTYDTNILVTGTAVALTASGTNLAGTAVSSTCSITRVLAMYVTNDDILGTNPSITIYPAAATADATPVATIKGASTAENAPQFPAVDAAGNLYVSNEGPAPGATYGPTSGYISVYAPGTGQVGNVAPITTISGLNRPEGLSIDPKGNLWATSLDRITEYAPTSAGYSVALSNTITGSNTMLQTCYGMTTTATTVYVTCTPYPFSINYFPITATGNATPSIMTYVGAVAAAGMTVSYSTVSWLSIAVDSTGMMYAPDTNSNENAVYGFASGSTGMTPALIDAMGFNLPAGIFIDSAGTFYVTNYGNNTIETFASSTTLLAGVAATTLTGADTGLAHPYGVTVR